MTTCNTQKFLPMCPFCKQRPIIMEDGASCWIAGIPSCDECSLLAQDGKDGSWVDDLIQAHPGLSRVELCRCTMPTNNDTVMCANLTTWQYNGFAMCHQCLKAMADMNSDNEEAVAEALEKPELTVGMRVHILLRFRFEQQSYLDGTITAHVPSRPRHPWFVMVDGINDIIAYNATELAPIA